MRLYVSKQHLFLELMLLYNRRSVLYTVLDYLLLCNTTQETALWALHFPGGGYSSDTKHALCPPN